VIQRRLHRLSAEELQVLRIASVIGEKFNPALVAQIHNQPLNVVLNSFS
jgi:predicted ATPase